MNLLDQLKRIERIDQLIRMKATGNPNDFSNRLSVSKKTLYNTLNFMKGQGALIYYCSTRQSFCYERETYFHFGFTIEKVMAKQIQGGSKCFSKDFFGECNLFTISY